MDFESEKKRQNKIQPSAGVKDGVFGIGQKGLPVAVGVRPKGKVPFFQQLNTQMPGWDFQQSRIPFEEYSVCKQKILENEQKKGQKNQEICEVSP